MDGFALAMRALEQHLERRRRGEAVADEELLQRHPDLRDVLQAMLAAAGDAPAPETAADPTRSGPAAAATWHGLPASGDALGGYRIGRVLGQGGMGIVFLAEDMRLNRKVALKLVRPERLASDAARDRFWREAKLAARLEHPHICAVYEVGETAGIPFMAMRYLEGETLAARIAARGPRPDPRTPSTTTSASRIDGDVGRTVHLIERVAMALHYAHERGVVHRDIKPSNILIDASDAPFVLDFGMARDVDDDWALTMTGELVGTPLYMPPEQVSGRPGGSALDRRADVYSLGVTLYEALTGVRPFEGASIRELLDAIVRHHPPPARRHNPRVPRDLDVVLAKAIEKHPDRRYKTAADLAEDLRRVRAHEPVVARRAGPLLRGWRWVQRNPVAAGFLAVVATALVVIALLYLQQQRAHQREMQALLLPRLRELRDSETALYARWPNHAGDLGAWEHKAEALLADAGAVRRAPAPPDAAADPAERLRRQTLATFERELAEFTDESTGLLARVRRNLAWARQAEERTVADHREAWDHAVAAIAKSPRYGGLRLVPQIDLVPIGPDPATGLWEFGHPRSGGIPERAADGKLPVADATGIVFVLLPGGTFAMGAQNGDRGKANYDELARPEEGPVREVALAAYFIAKHELTQGQWLALGAPKNPSEFFPGAPFKVRMTLAHPVEMVAWNECVDLIAQHGLLLPTEAQWEYACRGGMQTPWWSGDDSASLDGRTNLADKTAKAAGVRWTELDDRFEDGFIVHAPVDALTPNPFGLYHVTGNVLEWCRDVYVPYAEATPRAGDGLLSGERTSGPRAVRGGSFSSTAGHCRSAYRGAEDPARHDNRVGLRPVYEVRSPAG